MPTQNSGDTATTGGPKRRGLGFVPGPGQAGLLEREQIAKANLTLHRAFALTLPSYPAAFDWRNVNGANYITPIRDQGGCGSCVAFGTVGAVEGTLRVNENNPNLPVDLSEAQLFYCYAEALEGRNCDEDAHSGWWPDRALYYFQNDGVVDEACFPYTDHDQSCNLCSDSATRLLKIASSQPLHSLTDMKNWLSTNGPLITCFTVYDDFYSHYSGGIYHYDGHSASVGGHCVCVVGYDDNQNYWICKNQWGASWGESGYFRIGYGEVGIDSEMYGVVVVTQTPVVTWANPPDIVYGTALGAAQLNATASVPGTFDYNPPAGTILNAGLNQTLSTTFTPTSPEFQQVTTTVQINVLKATPTITWANPPDIDYGTPLDPTQLNATASVPGTLVYNPSAGAVLNIGHNQPLHVDFTPLDTVDYDPASATVYLNVLTGTPIIVGTPTFQPTVLDQGNRVQVSVTIKNDSIKPHLTQGPNPDFQYNEGDTFQTKGFAPVAGAYRIGVDYQETQYKVDHPYRWGFGKTLAPGETVVVTGYVRFPNSRHNGHYYVGLVQEPSKWIDDHEGTTIVTVNRP